MRKGFTVPEMLAVVAIIVIIMSILLPVIIKTRVPVYQAVCAGNNRQLVQASITYSADNSQWLPFTNWGSQEWGRKTATKYEQWLTAGWLYNYPDWNKPGDQKNGQLWPYLRELSLYRCPQETGPFIPDTTHQITSYLMNGAFSGFGGNTAPTSPGQPPPPLQFIYKSFRFAGDTIMFWEVDSDSLPNYYNDGSSRPDETLTKRHLTGLTVGCRDGHTEWLSYDEYWAIESKDPGRLWCKPDSANGH